MTQPRPEISPLHLRDRLYATLTEFEVKEPVQAVEAICEQFAGWLRLVGKDWYDRAAFTGDLAIASAARPLLDGLADGISEGAPGVTNQDPGVQ